MSITDKVRKELWGKSGNKCAICHIDLFREGRDESYTIGEECHIISEKPNGPRYQDGIKDYDSYENLILLCRNHHKKIDDPANITEYSIEALHNIKKKHEKWVRQRLLDNRPDSLSLIKNGNELVSILGAGIVKTFNDNPSSTNEAEYIGGILDDILDFTTILSELEPSDITKKEFTYSKMLEEMATKGFFLYGNTKKMPLFRYMGDYNLYNVAILYLKKVDVNS